MYTLIQRKQILVKKYTLQTEENVWDMYISKIVFEFLLRCGTKKSAEDSVTRHSHSQSAFVL